MSGATSTRGSSDLTIDTSHRPYDSIAEEVAAWVRT